MFTKKNELTAYQRLTSKLINLYTDRENDGHKNEEWNFIPYDIQEFVHLFKKAYKKFTKYYGRPPESFLEIGCGYGFNRFIANHLTGYEFKSHGLEKNTKYIDRAINSGNIFQGDALTFKKYSDYDLLYFYMPFSNEKFAKKFIKRLLKQSRGIIFGSSHGINETELENHTINDVNDGFIYCTPKEKLS